jgi:hypothetical protein
MTRPERARSPRWARRSDPGPTGTPAADYMRAFIEVKEAAVGRDAQHTPVLAARARGGARAGLRCSAPFGAAAVNVAVPAHAAENPMVPGSFKSQSRHSKSRLPEMTFSLGALASRFAPSHGTVPTTLTEPRPPSAPANDAEDERA